jgi:hypothetical protein
MKHLLLLLVLPACRDALLNETVQDTATPSFSIDTETDSADTAQSGSDTHGGSDSGVDTGDIDPPVAPMVPLQCTGSGIAAPGADEPIDVGDTLARVLTIDSPEFDQLCAYLTYPRNGESSWKEGAAVVVYVRPGITAGMESNPPPAFQGASGVVEILGIHPDMPWYGCETSGEFDFGGARAAMAMAEVMRFALGERTTTDGYRIDELVNQPVCNSAIAVMSSSSGAFTAANALAKSPDLAHKILGMTTFEPVSMPLFVQAEPGHIYFDPDDQVDGDGNGLTWDDGRNLSFDDASCTSMGCDNDLSTLDITVDSSGHVSQLWLDRDQDGVHDKPNDFNDDGYISIDEDFVFPEPLVLEIDGETVSMWSPALISAVWSQVLEEGETPPPNLATVAQAEDFWADRDQVSLMRETLSFHHPDFLNMISWSAIPHHIPWPSRPAETVVGDLTREQRSPVLFNPSLQAAGCLVDPSILRDYPGGAPLNEIIIGPEAFDHHALPESLLPQTALALATTGLLWHAVGPFDDCDRLSLTLTALDDE